MSLFVGIDVGANGGIVSISRDKYIYTKEAIPKLKGGKGVDYDKMRKIIANLRADNGFNSDVIVCIEDVHSLYGMSAKSNFSFGYIKGVTVEMVDSAGYEFHLVPSKVWQKAVWIPEDVVLKDGKKKDTKATSLNTAKRLWPDEHFLASARSRVPHDGIVDAALMAEYCRIVNE